jgi:hypothetical protein
MSHRLDDIDKPPIGKTKFPAIFPPGRLTNPAFLQYNPRPNLGPWLETMQPNKRALLVVAFTAASFVLAESGQAHKRDAVVGTSDVAHAVVGRICTTPTGATFDFGKNGEYRYSGLWKSDGHYKISPGMITVALHSGLVRSFAVSLQSGRLMLESTAVVCKKPIVAHLHE